MKQKLVSILLVLCMVVALVPAIALTSAAANTVEDTNKDGTLPAGAEVLTGTATAFSGGDGSAEDPYQIKDITEFRYFQSLLLADSQAETPEYLNKSYKLTGDIIFNKKLSNHLDADGVPTDYKYTGVNGAHATVSNKQVCALQGDFSGIFDGANFGIYNLYARFHARGGLFDTVSGTVKNLNLYGGYMFQGAAEQFGSIAASLKGGTIANCYSSVDMYGNGNNSSVIAGIVGAVTADDSIIKDCTYAGRLGVSHITGTAQIAGIVARVGGGLSVVGCVNRANINTGATRLGGIVGFLICNGKNVTVEYCANYGNITTTASAGDKSALGGIVGHIYQGTLQKIEYCANYGNIRSTADTVSLSVAGIVPAGSSDSLKHCANYGNLRGGITAGIACETYINQALGCYSDGTITTTNSKSAQIFYTNWVNIAGSSMKNFVGVGTVELIYQYRNSGNSIQYSNTKLYSSKDELNIPEAVKILNTGLETPVWVAGKTAPELKWIADMNATPAPEITIDGASLTIGGNVTMNLFVKKTTVAAAGVTLGKISIVDNDNTPYEVTDDSGDYYVFTIKGLRASEFGKTKTYHVQYTTADAPGTAIDCTTTKEYSPLQYAINMYNADKDAKTVTDLDKLLLSIVNYADAAATAAGTADTGTVKAAFREKHADADFSTLPKFAEDIIAKDTGVYTYDKLKTEKNLPGISADLTETIALTFIFNSIGSYTYMKDNSDMMMIGNAVIKGSSAGLDSVVFSGLFATDLYNTITLTFKETLDSDSGLTVTATTSLVQFLKSYKEENTENTTYAALAEATAQYLYVARNFCLNNQPNA